MVCSDFCVYGVVQRHLYCVPHYLTGRYVNGVKMEQAKCIVCNENFSSKVDLNKHHLECKAYLLQLTPSFKIEISKRKRKARKLIQGTYEWALSQSLPKNAGRSISAIDLKYTQLDLEKEICRSEREIAMSELVSDKALNRQIVVCHVLQKKINHGCKLELQKRSKRKMQNGKSKKTKPQGTALGSVFDTKYTPFVSGGAPGLGKRA